MWYRIPRCIITLSLLLFVAPMVAKAQSTRLGLPVSSGTNLANVAIRSLSALPLSSSPGWKIGVPGGSAFSLASTWLLLRI